MSSKLLLSNMSVEGKRVLMRVDFNVPLNEKGEIVDDARIVAALPSIRYVLEHGGRLVLMSHLGRPKGGNDPKFSLKPCAERLSQLIGLPVLLAPDCVGPEAEKLSAALKAGEVLLLENLRFHRGEEFPDEEPGFVDALAKLGDLYVNDAFGTAHRAHASTKMVAEYFSGHAAAGFLMEKELQFLGKVINKPSRPFHAIIGGAKISSKIGTLTNLFKKVDVLYIAGAMAYTFFKAEGIAIGETLYEEAYIDIARRLLEESRHGRVLLQLPIDHVISNRLDGSGEVQTVDVSAGVPAGWYAVDIGPKTLEQFKDKLQQAATILWNGPAGIYEIPRFALGTNELAKIVAGCRALVVVGGGDSVAAVQASGVADQIAHLSTGGGATLEFLEYGSLPGIESLTPASASGIGNRTS